MMTYAKLFRTTDVIAVITGVSLDRCRRSKVDELVHYVTGYRSMPEKGSSARRDVVATIRSQLPSRINEFGVLDLIRITVMNNEGQQESRLRAALIEIVEKRYGRQLVLSPAHTLETPCENLLLFRSLAERPNAKFALD